MEPFFRFAKSIVTGGTWRDLSTAGRAVYPVVGVHANRKGEAWPSMDRIGELCGLSRQTVSKGVTSIVENKLMFADRKLTKRGHVQNIYKLLLPQQRRTFFFSEALIHSGAWASLNNYAKNLYVVFRAVAYFDLEGYRGAEEDDYFADEGNYRDLRFEFCDPDPWGVACLSGMCDRAQRKGINSLMDHGLLEETDSFSEGHPRRRWKIYRCSPGERDDLSFLV